MMNHRLSSLRGFAGSLAVLLLVANAAQADIDWVLQPSSTVSLTGQLGTYFGSANNIVELYNIQPQTDANTSLFPGFTNGLVTYSAGTMRSVGNNFLSSLNFGNEPDYTLIHLNSAKTVIQNNGLWLPNVANGSDPSIPDYGAPQLQNLAGKLVPIPGYPFNNSPDGGRVSVSTGYGTFSSSNGGAVIGTNGAGKNMHAGVAMPVNSSGHFVADNMAVSGQFNLNASLNMTQGQIAFPLGEVGTATPNIGDNLDGFITRGVGANASQYIVHIPLPAFSDSGTFGALYYNLNLQYNLVAAANLAPGDANFDGIVNGQDIALVASNWLTNDPTNKLAAGDVNGDGIVNGQDIALIASNWLALTPALPAGAAAPVPGGGTPGDVDNGGTVPGVGNANAVPEPGTWVLLGLGGIGLALYRRRSRR